MCNYESVNKYFLTFFLIGSALFFSGCEAGRELFKQALEETAPSISEIQVDSVAPVILREIDDFGYVLETQEGQPLYTRKSDSLNYSTCYNACATNWPPFIVDSMDQVSGNYSAFDRGNGLQVTYNGFPLYTHAADDKHEVTGNGSEDLWEVVKIHVPPDKRK